MLAGAGVIAGLTGGAVLAARDVVRPWSLALSGGLVVLGVVAAATAQVGSDALLLGLPPLVGGAVTVLLVLRR